MNDQPVTVSEIADLLDQLRAVSYPAPFDLATRTAALASKAELLARITAQNAADADSEPNGDADADTG
jgi:hypothetical protein